MKHAILPTIFATALFVSLAGSANAQGTTQLATSKTIEYQAYARTFKDPHKQPVLVLLASCHYNRGGYVLGFQQDRDGTWSLMERKPQFGSEVITYYSITTSQPYQEVPRSVTVKDASGTHTVQVKPWPK